MKDIVQLLEGFQFVVPIGYNSLLVPALLTDDVAIVTIVKGSFPRPATLSLHTSQPDYLPKAITTTPLLHMLGTDVVMRRLYILHGIPIGFWPRLVAHFYTEKIFGDIVKKAMNKASQQNVDLGDKFTPNWHYAKRSIELTVNNIAILSIGSVGRDYMDLKQKYQRSEIDLANFHFVNDKGEWENSDFKFYSGVLIEVNDFIFVSSNDSQAVIQCTPDICQHSAELLAFTVEMLDSLLSEVFHRARVYDDSSWLKELIPCPFCLGDKRVGEGGDYECQDDGEVNCCSEHRTVRDLSQDLDIVCYFTINHCLTKVKNNEKLVCPKHGHLTMECLAPDLVCLTLL